MSEYSYNADAKEATVFTKQHNAAFAQQFAIDLEDAYNSEVALARRGCLKKLDGFRLKDKTGNVVWDLQAYDFLKQQAVADTVHPSLWLNGKANIEAGVFEVLAGKIYQVRGIDVANLTFVRSKTGWIVIDVTTNTEAAAYGLRITEEVLGENIRDHIRAVIISHSHADHFGGIKGIVSPQQVGKAEGQVRIYVPAGFDEETVKENVYAGTAMFHRSKYQFGGDLLAGSKGRVSTGLGLGTSSGTLSYITPTDFIAEDTTLTIDGLEVEFQLTPGTEAPAEMNFWIGSKNALWMAENCTGTLHNLYTLRGAQVRDGNAWAEYIMESLALYGDQADVVFQSHNWPHWGKDIIQEYMTNTAAVYKFINDQTLLYINEGYTETEIANMIQLPKELEKVWYTRQYYGTVSHNSKAVYEKYMGWYDGNPVHLAELTPSDYAQKLVEYFGDTDAVLEKAKEDFAKGEYQWVAQITNTLVFADPENMDARYLCADALEQLGYQAESGPWRSAYLCAAQELRNGTNTDDATRGNGNGDVILHMTPEMILDYLGILVDTTKVPDLTFTANLILPEGNYVLRVKNGVLLYQKDTQDADADVTWTTKRAGLLSIIQKNTENIAALIQQEGDETCLTRLMDAVMVTSEYKYFNIIEP